MNQKEFNEMLLTLPREEKQAFQKWFIEYHDILSWEQFQTRGYRPLRENKRENRHVSEVVQTVQQHVAEKSNDAESLNLAFMPTKLARISPFFPMSKREMKNRPEYKDVTLENPWGKITISGPKLAIYDETLLLALLVLVKDSNDTSVHTSYSALCELMRVSKGKNTFMAIDKSLSRLTSAKVTTELLTEQDKGQRRRRAIMQGAILSNAYQDQETRKLIIAINPYFVALYGKGMAVSLDIDKRAELKGDLAKALYRFLKTHKRQETSVPYGLMTLATAVNVNTEQPVKEIRKKIRAALAELKKNGHVQTWRVDQNDNVHLKR